MIPINMIISFNSLTHPTTEPALRDQVKLIALDVSHNKLDKVTSRKKSSASAIITFHNRVDKV